MAKQTGDGSKFNAAKAAAKLRLAQDGHDGALGDVLMLYRPLLLKIAQEEVDSKLRIKKAASDLVQDTLLEAHRDFEKLRSCAPDEFRRWLVTALRRNLADAQRQYRRSKSRQISRERPLVSDHVRELLGRLSMRKDPGPQSDAIRREDRERVIAAMDKLDRAYRQVLLWRFRDGLEFAAIGAKIERSADATRMLCNRAMKRIKEIMDTPNE